MLLELSWWWCIYAIFSFVALNAFFIYNEKYQHRTAWPIPCTHDEMVLMAKKKKDNEMNADEFNIKYAAFRHEIFRFALLNKKMVVILNYLFHYIEVFLIHGGRARLRSKYPIKAPIFIIGDFRSGTSVLERLISHHPNVAYFTLGNQAVWCGPYLWNKLLAWMGVIRADLLGHKSWNRPGNPGIYYPHSSNVLLHRGRPFEIENLWEFASRNLTTHRCNDWRVLDDVEENSDHHRDWDLLDASYSDARFEQLFVDSIHLILAKANIANDDAPARFILKNPLNGYRIAYLHKLFPDAKFIHIARNPLKTTLSQIELARSNLRCFFLEEQFCRTHNNRPPPIPQSDPQYTQSWNYLFNGKHPNEELGTLWFPRQFPRTKPEYEKITKYLKNNSYECAVATAVTQHERVAFEAFEKIGAVQGQNLLSIWHEDILEDASKTFEILMNFLNLECSAQDRLKWLEREDFPNGQANKIRVQKSDKHETVIDFGPRTNEVVQILENNAVMDRYRQRESVHVRF